MKPKPIIFSSGMVRAIRADQKTSTCRIAGADKPPYKIGDILYVRESVAVPSLDYNNGLSAAPPVIYQADYKEPVPKPWDLGPYLRWEGAGHMNADTARIFLEVTKVTPKYIMLLDDTDIIKEGISLDLGRELTSHNALRLSGGANPPGPYDPWQFICLYRNPIPQNPLKDPTFCSALYNLCFYARAYSLEEAMRGIVFRTLWNTLYAKPKPRKTNGKISHYESFPYQYKDRHQADTINGKPHTVTPNPLVHMYEFQRIEKPD